MDELTTMLEGDGSNAQKREWSIERSKLAQEINAAEKVAAEKEKQKDTEKEDASNQATEKSTEKQ